jgi:hypothetical protein
MSRNLIALAGHLVLSHVAPAQSPELDPRFAALEARVSAALPSWIQDSDLAPSSFAAWDLKLPDGGLARCQAFRDALGADPEKLVQGMALSRPGAKLVGEPRVIKRPSAIEVQTTFAVPGEGYAFGLRTSVKDDVATVMSGPSFPVPKGWKSVAEPTTAMDWAGDGDARLTLDVVSTLEHSADALIAAATDKKTKVAPEPKGEHDVSFVDGKDQVRLEVIEQDGYLYLIRASAPVAESKTKLAAFEKAIAPTFAGK